jgi:antitoxin PrlF
MSRATMRDRGQVTLPREVRDALHVDAGDELIFEVTDQGVVVSGMKMIPTEQSWFWTERWQRGEREASREIATGRTTKHKDADEMFNALRS